MQLALKTIAIFLLACRLIVINNAFAHPDHDHVLNKEQAILRAASVVESLVVKGKSIEGEKLDDSWKQATMSGACKKPPEYFLISFSNRTAGKVLYVLLTISGKYLRANFDGDFADLTFSPYPVQRC